MQPVHRSYAPIGLKIYYEIHGQPSSDNRRPPLMLLHGGGDTIETSFGKLLPELTRHRQVIAFEQRGFGRTADIADRPFNFEESAQDTIDTRLLKAQGSRLARLQQWWHDCLSRRTAHTTR